LYLSKKTTTTTGVSIGNLAVYFIFPCI